LLYFIILQKVYTMTEQEKNKLVLQYEPLINKITAQFYAKNKVSETQFIEWELIHEMAYEGFAMAINDYNPDRSTMSFMQYAAFAIRNNILNCLTEESRTVKLPYEEQQKRKENGGALFNTVSIDHNTYGDDDDDEGPAPRKVVMAMSQSAKFDDGDIFEYFYSRLEGAFPQRECEMFYMTFGLKGFDETPNQDIAKKFGVSEGLISQKKKKIIDWIKKDTELCEMLSNLL